MNNFINDIKRVKEVSNIVFPEGYFKSDDNKTVMGEITFGQILFLDYRETEAGSNPREYNGLKQTNLKILKSLLKDYKNMFRFLHSGVIVSLVNPNFISDKEIHYDDCCLTNGNQTRFIILIIVLLKLMSENQELKPFKQGEYHSFIKQKFFDNEAIKNILRFVKLNKVNEITNFLLGNRKYLILFAGMVINNFLNAKIRVQINIIDTILPDLNDPVMDTYRAGTLIAEANNDTQNVKVDDIFGTKNRNQLNEKIFKDFNSIFHSKVEIEFRLGEVVNKIEKVHILTLLRLVVATGILCKENDIFKLTNQRMPVYNLFEKLLKKDHAENTIKAISKIIPELYKIRTNYVEPFLEKFKRQFVREYKEKAISGNLQHTIIQDKINSVIKNDDELEKLIQRNINYNIEHIIPVLIFRIRNLFQENEYGQLDLTIPDNDNRHDFFKGLIEAIYKKYIDLKLAGLPTSLTTVVRDRKYYESGSEAYIASKNYIKFSETDYVTKNSCIFK
jgi:hypothetical protein